MHLDWAKKGKHSVGSKLPLIKTQQQLIFTEGQHRNFKNAIKECEQLIEIQKAKEDEGSKTVLKSALFEEVKNDFQYEFTQTETDFKMLLREKLGCTYSLTQSNQETHMKSTKERQLGKKSKRYQMNM